MLFLLIVLIQHWKVVLSIVAVIAALWMVAMLLKCRATHSAAEPAIAQTTSEIGLPEFRGSEQPGMPSNELPPFPLVQGGSVIRGAAGELVEGFQSGRNRDFRERAPHGNAVQGTAEPEAQSEIKHTEADLQRESLTRAEAQTDQEPAQGRVLIDHFIALMRKNGVPPETIFRETRGPRRWSYDSVVGSGWRLESHPNSLRRELNYCLYIIPGVGFAEVVPRLPSHQMIKVLRYPTEPDNSDKAYRSWAGKADRLESIAQTHIASTNSGVRGP